MRRSNRWAFARTPFPERSAPPSASPATRRRLRSGTFDEMAGVQEVIRVSKPYKLVSRDLKEEDTVVRFPDSDATFGGDEVAVIAGPCAIESREQAFATAECVARAGARFFRGGAYKPRTSPYSFQGLAEDGPEDPGRNPRPLRPADRHRGHRQRIARTGGEVRRRDPDRRAQHAELLAAEARRHGRASRCC